MPKDSGQDGTPWLSGEENYIYGCLCYMPLSLLYICLNSFPFCMYNKTSHSSKKCNACSRQVTIVYDVVNNKDVNIMLRVNNIGPFFMIVFFSNNQFITPNDFGLHHYSISFFLSIVDLYFCCQQAEFVIANYSTCTFVYTIAWQKSLLSAY